MTNSFRALLIVAVGLLPGIPHAGQSPVSSRSGPVVDVKPLGTRDSAADRPVVPPVNYVPVGSAASSSAVDSRGAVVAQTYNDVPANVNAGRTVATVPPSVPAQPGGVHFAISFKSAPGGLNRMGYSCYDPLGGGSFPIPGGKVVVASDTAGSVESGGNPKVMVLPDGRAILAGYTYPDVYGHERYNHVILDLAPFAGNFGGLNDGSIIDSATDQSGNFDVGFLPSTAPYSCLDINGAGANDTVMYLWTTGGAYSSRWYAQNKVFRKVGTSMPGEDTGWTLVFTDSGNGYRGGGLACDPTSTRVAVFTTLNAAYDTTGIHGKDVRWADSPTGLSGTWTKHNLTNINPSSLDIPFLEVEGMFDSQGQLHLIFNATYNRDGQTYYSILCRGLHWSEHDPSKWYVFYDATWSVDNLCGRNGFNVMNIGQMSIGECENRLYVVYSAANDPNYVPNGDDCVTSQTVFLHKGNGEIYVTVSKDLAGKSWDRPRNVSNSYTPNCDTGTCASDMYPALDLYGMDDADYAGVESWTNADATWDPSSGSYTGSRYIQLFYLQDRYPSRAGANYTGGIVPPWTLNDMRWVRMACAAPIEAAGLTLSRDSIAWPEWHRPGHDTTFKIILTASGNSDLIVSSITAIEDSAKGPGAGPTGWMSIGSVPTMIPEGGVDSMNVTLNTGGIVAAGPTVLFGKVRFSYTPPAQTKDLIIKFPVADTVALAIWDTISTSCLDLVVGTDGNVGHSGGDSLHYQNGKVNMDYVGHGDCDTGTNSRGNAAIYLFSGSPMIIRQTGPTSFRGSWSWSATAGSIEPEVAFKPIAGFAPHGSFSTSSYNGFNSGTILTSDSLVKVELTWWAPTHADSCNFIIQRMRVFSANIGSPVTHLQIGQGADWDIPADTFAAYFSTVNFSGTDPGRRMIFVRGQNRSDTVTDCADNSTRYGGMALLNWFMKDKACYDSLFGAVTFAHDAYAHPGIVADSMSRLMHLGGYAVEPVMTDVSALLTYKDGPTGYTLPANDTLTVFTALATVRTARSTGAGLDSLKKAIDRARDFMKKDLGFCASCCQGVTGNVNMTGIVDLSDLSALVSYLTGGGYVLTCPAEANVNNIGIVDLSDLSSLVSYLTGGGFVLPNCP